MNVATDVFAICAGDRVALPSVVLTPLRLSTNVTDPVGTPAPGGVDWIVAVRVIVCPKTDGLGEMTSSF